MITDTIKQLWPKKTVAWRDNGTVNISVPFTWNLPDAYSKCLFFRDLGYRVRAGGPAVSLMPEYLKRVAEIGGEVGALRYHNPWATVTSRGCIRKCPFCAVPKIEGDLRELSKWEPQPIVCDNNLLACSRRHFDKVIDSLKELPWVDFNQGLDARLLTAHHINRLQELKCKVRLAWDNTKDEQYIMKAIAMLRKAGWPVRALSIYVLIGYNETPEDALYRLATIKKLSIHSFPQRYQPLDTLKKNSYVAPSWTQKELFRYIQYWGRQRIYANIPFKEFDRATYYK